MCNLDNLIIFQVYYFHLSISQNTPQESSTLPSKTCVAQNHNVPVQRPSPVIYLCSFLPILCGGLEILEGSLKGLGDP